LPFNLFQLGLLIGQQAPNRLSLGVVQILLAQEPLIVVDVQPGDGSVHEATS